MPTNRSIAHCHTGLPEIHAPRPVNDDMAATPETPHVALHAELLPFALDLADGGCSVIPVRRDKRPWINWKPYQAKAAVPEEIIRWATDPRTTGFALVCGPVSGGAEVLDFDEAEFYPAWLKAAPAWAKDLPTQRTGRGGYQVAYRRPLPPGNTKLAWVPCDPDQDGVVIPAGREIAIETRGTGGYALIPYSLHPSGAHYTVLHGNWSALPTLTEAQAEELWAAARGLCRVPLSRQDVTRLQRGSTSRVSVFGQDGESVVQAYNARTDIHQALSAAGYTQFTPQRYTRPGLNASPGGVHLLEDERGRLCSYHHSSNDLLNDGHLHDPFDLFVAYQHGGDFKAAVKSAARELGLVQTGGATASQAALQLGGLRWGARELLPPALPPAPTLPSEMVPEALRAWLEDVADLACVPLEGVAAPALVGLSGLIGRSVQIDPEGLGDWNVVPNLWGALVMRPSGMKSMQLGRALEPLRDLENRARHEFEAGAIDRELRVESLKVQEEQIKKNGRSKGGKLDMDALRDLKQEAREAALTPQRYIVQDTTHEKLGELLRDNPRGLTMLRDELSGWIDAMSREEYSEARAFWLSSWNGDGTHDFDRIGRGTVRVDHLCVAVVGAIQPGPLQRFVTRSRAGGADDVGFLQRFQLLIYPDGLPKWKRPIRRVDTQARARAFAVYEVLDALRHAAEPVKLAFSVEAQPIFQEWRDALENRLRGGELARFPAFESHLGKYRSLVPSLALVFHLVDVAAQPSPLPPVSIDALELALNWAEFLELHARKVYASDLGVSKAPAHALAERITSGAVRNGDRLRDLRRKDWAGLKGDALDIAVEQLTALGWVQVEEIETGGRPAEVLCLHPELIGGKT